MLKRSRLEFMNKGQDTIRRDPLTVFPTELIETILLYLEFYEIVLVEADMCSAWRH